MAKSPRLFIDEDHKGFRLFWYFPDEDSVGGALGDGGGEFKVRPDRAKFNTLDEFEDALCIFLAGQSRNVLWEEYRGFYWERKADASAVLRVIKAEMKATKAEMKAAKAETPLPEWAKQALVAGWKAPKGWKP